MMKKKLQINNYVKVIRIIKSKTESKEAFNRVKKYVGLISKISNIINDKKDKYKYVLKDSDSHCFCASELKKISKEEYEKEMVIKNL